MRSPDPSSFSETLRAYLAVTVDQRVHILWVDDSHLGDPLFGQQLARTLGQAPSGELRALVVHSGGDDVDRLLEMRGQSPIRSDGILVIENAQEQALVERAIREANKRLTGVLTEFAVPAVSIQGSDRGLLHRNEHGQLSLGRFSWLRTLIGTGAVPVVSSLAASAAGAAEAALGRCVATLARAFEAHECVVVVLEGADRKGLAEKEDAGRAVDLETLRNGPLRDALEEVRGLVNEGYEVRLTPVRYAISADLGLFRRVIVDKSG